MRIFPVGWEAPEGESNRAGRENCHSIVHEQRSEGLILHHQLLKHGLCCRWNAYQAYHWYHQNLGRIDEMKHLPGAWIWKTFSLVYYSSFGGDLRSVVYVSWLKQKTARYSLCSEVYVRLVLKTCLLQKRLPLSAVKAMVIFHVRCDRCCLYCCDSENNIFKFLITGRPTSKVWASARIALLRSIRSLRNMRICMGIACENIRFSSLFAAGDVSRGDFCRWVADVAPRETSPVKPYPATESEEKRMFSQVSMGKKPILYPTKMKGFQWKTAYLT